MSTTTAAHVTGPNTHIGADAMRSTGAHHGETPVGGPTQCAGCGADLDTSALVIELPHAERAGWCLGCVSRAGDR